MRWVVRWDRLFMARGWLETIGPPIAVSERP